MKLDKGVPVAIIPFNQRYLPGASDQERILKTYGGALLVIGYDKEHNVLYCIDAHGKRADGGVGRTVSIPVDFFLKGIDIRGKYSCITFDILENTCSDINWREILRSSAETLMKHNKEGYNKFDLMDRLSFEINDLMDFSVEFDDKIPIDDIPLIKSFKTICRSRYLFTIALSYLHKIYNYQIFETLISEFMRVAAFWNAIKFTASKPYYTKDYNIKSKLASKITDVAKMEKHLAESILKITDPGYKEANVNIYFNDKGPKINKYVCLNLKDFVNNKCCAINIDNVYNARFTDREYFVVDNLCDGNFITVNNIKYQLQNINSKGFDNISCLSQTIPVPCNNYKSIMILANSEGYYCDNIKISYSDGTEENIVAGFSNWFGEPMFGEDKVLHGKRVKDNNIVKNDKAYIFSKAYSINENKKVISIMLPENNKIHIFAITLVA